jgi:TolB-like protein/DNA-binding winged helix-turn-helix (wHTH) protein/Flp pilus assembly protein TadD
MMASSGCFSMSPAPKTPTTIRFEGYELDQSSEELRKDGNSLKLQPQPFKVLAFLASRPGELVTRNELREHLWPGDTFVDFDLAINQAIKQIRAILCDDADRPRMIATLPRRGYRFIAKAELATAAESEQLSNGSYPSSTASGTIVNELGRDRSRKLQWVVFGAAVLLVSIVFGYRIATKSRASTNVRIVVLPFQNLTGEPNQEFFADGMTEEMISQLGAMDPNLLGVIARTSAVKYKNSGKGIDQIGKELRVDYVLEGSVREAASRVRITAQLIRVADQMHVWSESFDRNLQDTMALQADVAQAIASRIDVRLGQHRAQSPQAVPTNWEAYSAYLKGRHILLDNKSAATIKVALEYFERAIHLDPNFALAYAGIADAYAEQADSDLDPAKAFALSKDAATRALSISPDLAEAHVSLANELLYGEWKWSEAEREYRLALQVKPTYEEAHHSYSHYLTLAGRHEQAISESLWLLQVDPLSSHMNSHLGLAFLRGDRFDEALSQFKKTMALDPNYVRVYVHMGSAYESRKMYSEAIAAFRKAVSLSGETIEGKPELARALIEGGETEEGLRMARALEAEAKRRYVSLLDMAGIYTALGEHDKALALLERALHDRNGGLLSLHQQHAFDALRGSVRFGRILREIGAPRA